MSLFASSTLSGVSRLAAPRWSSGPHSDGHHFGPIGVSGASPESDSPTSARGRNRLAVAARRYVMAGSSAGAAGVESYRTPDRPKLYKEFAADPVAPVP